MNRRVFRTWRTTLAIFAVLLGLTALLLTFIPRAEARAIELEQPSISTGETNPTIWIEQIHGRWFFVELYDRSMYLVTPCRTTKQHNCYWMGGPRVRKYVDIDGVRHWKNYAYQP